MPGLKSDLRGIETKIKMTVWISPAVLKSDLRGIETVMAERKELPEFALKSDLRGIETSPLVSTSDNIRC